MLLAGDTPFYGVPFPLPALIQAEDFDNGGEGVSYHSLDTVNQGGAYRNTGVGIEAAFPGVIDVSYTHAGEWLQYTINVPAAGSYDLTAQVADASAGATFHLEANGANVTGSMTMPNTGAFGNFKPIHKTITLAAGVQILRLAFDSNDGFGFAGNVDWLRLVPTPPAQRTLVTFDDKPANTIITNQYAGFTVQPGSTVAVIDAIGAGPAESGSQVLNISTPAPGVEFATPSIVGKFAQTAKSISLYAGLLNGTDPTNNPATTITLKAFDANHNLVGQDSPITTVSGVGVHTPLEVDSASANIASFEVDGGLNDTPIAIDDLSYVVPPVVQPDFSLQPVTTGLKLGPGTSVTDTIDVTRINGSTGNLQFDTVGLPAGVAASFLPNPAGGDSTLMTLTAFPNAVPTGDQGLTFSVRATPLSTTAGTATRTAPIFLIIRPDFTVSAPNTPIDMAAAVTVPLTVTRDITFVPGSPISMTIGPLPAGISASFDKPQITANDFTGGGAFAPVNLTLTAAHGTLLFDFDFDVFAKYQQESSSTHVFIHRIAGRIDSITPIEGKTPQDLKPGTKIVLKGIGLVAGSQVQFGNAEAATAPAFAAADGSEIDVLVPRLATTGPITIVNPDGLPFSSASAFTVDSFRDTYGFARSNDISNFPTTFNDLSALFGYNATHASIDPFFPEDFGQSGVRVTIDQPSLYALAFLSAIQDSAKDGQCYGFSLAADRFLHGDALLSSFPPPGARTTWQLDAGQSDDSIAGPTMHYIHQQHIAQFSAEGLAAQLADATLHVTSSSQDIYNEVTGDLAKGLYPLVCIHDQGEGHCLLVYDVEAGSAPGDFYIDVYDPNRPFNVSENSDGAAHQSQEQNSRIHITPDGRWSFFGDFGGVSPNWGGKFENMTFTPYGAVPVQPSLPGKDALGLFVPFGAASVAQISDAAGHTLFNADGTENTDPNTRLPQATIFKPDLSPGGYSFLFGNEALTQKVMPTGGVYHETMLGQNFAARLMDFNGTAGVSDSLSIDATATRFAFTTGGPAKPLGVQLITDGAGNFERSATFNTTTFSQATDSFAFDPASNAVTFVHAGGATTFSLTLTQRGVQGQPEVFSTGQMSIAAGDSVSLAPADWTALNTTSVTMVVHHLDGSQTIMTLVNHSPGAQFKASEGTSFNAQVATFVPDGPPGVASDYQASIDWGDGTVSAAQVVIAPGNNIAVYGNHTYVDAGHFYTSMTLQGHGLTATADGQADVADVPLNVVGAIVTAPVATPLTSPLASFTDPNGDVALSDFVATINWGDGASTAGVIVSDPLGGFNVHGNHSYTAAGSYPTTVQVTDAASLSLNASTINASDGQNFSGDLVDFVLPVPGTTVDQYTATVNWGDGTSSSGIITLDAGSAYGVSGAHLYAKGGVYVPAVRIAGGPGVTVSGDVVVGGSTFQVVTTSDSGPGSLRQAIIDANGRGGTSVISFAIPGSGPQVISLLGPLPAITAPIVVDGDSQEGYAGKPLIELNGAAVGVASIGLVILGGNSIVRGLDIVGFGGGGILLSSAGHDLLLGNWIGVDAAGIAHGNGSSGILISGTSDNTIGGTAANDANVIAYNGGAGVSIFGAAPVVPFGNAIVQNRIYSNNALGIDLGADGVTLNTPGGPHVGPNNLQNFPVLNVVRSDSSGTRVSGTLNSMPSASFRIEFFASPAADPTGYGQGQLYIGSVRVTTDAAGNARFVDAPLAAVALGQVVSATATDAAGNTSEFSKSLTVTLSGDLDGDGHVDFADLVTLARHYGQAGTLVSGDLNGDCQVDFADLVILARNYGKSLVPTTTAANAAVLSMAGQSGLHDSPTGRPRHRHHPRR